MGGRQAKGKVQKRRRVLPPRRQRKQQQVDSTPLELPPDEAASLIDERDRSPRGHSLRVMRYSLDIARCLQIGPDSGEWLDLQYAAVLHDIGHLRSPDELLGKPGPLTPEEWAQLRLHPTIGYEMLRDTESLSGTAEIIYAHHERFDGKGYPRGLKGEQIPLEARIIAVAEAFDAMTSDQTYRRALPPDVVRGEILRHRGTQFDPRVVDAFLECYEGWVSGERWQPPTTRGSSSDRSKEMAWLAANRRDLEAKHAGKWIAVHGDGVVAVDEDLPTAIRKAKAKGIEDPLLVAARFKECQEAVQVAQWL